MSDLLSTYSNKSIKELTDYLDSFLNNGYLEEDSFEDPNDEAFYCLLSLSNKDGLIFHLYNKKVLGDECFASDYLKSTCLENLYFESRGAFFDYVENNLNIMGAAMLSKFLDTVSFILNEDFVRNFILNNEKRIKERIYMLKKTAPEECDFYQVEEFFIKIQGKI